MVGTTFEFEGATFTITALLGKGKSAYSWLGESADRQVVYKKMHDEKVDYYTFGNKVMAEVEAYERLLTTGARIPKLFAWSDHDQWLIKEYIHGPTGAELAAQDQLKKIHWEAILNTHARLKKGGHHVDYFPTNFIWQDGEMILIDYECHPYDREWDFPNWGMFYWLNSQGIREHLELGQSSNLNLPGSPKPIWEPFIQNRDLILANCGHPAEDFPNRVWTC